MKTTQGAAVTPHADTAMNIGFLAICWRRLDLAALALEERTSAAFHRRRNPRTGTMIEVPSAQKKIDQQWKQVAKQAASAHDDFMRALADAVPEQEDMFE